MGEQRRGIQNSLKSMNNGHIENSFMEETFTINIKIYDETFNLLWLNVDGGYDYGCL